jgi:2-polyprenyl-6-methoxyphenol hydroxylase-like FAD-dependent oxidoreductase
MTSIGIVGSGIAGLHLGLVLQQQGISATIYSDRTPDQIRAGRLPNSICRFGHTRARERELGVDHWHDPDFGVFGFHFCINGDPPLTFQGDVKRQASFVDMRLYMSALLEDFAARGGSVEFGAIDADDLGRLAQRHDLMVVAAGRASLTDLFPRVPEHSPYTAPQRLLCSGLYHGVAHPEPLGVSFNISPGHGEVIQGPFLSFAGQVANIFFEAIPGGGMEAIARMRYDEDPRGFEALALETLRTHAPAVYARVDPAAFRLTRPLDLLQGSFTPVVRRGFAPLDDGKYAMALGDVHVLNDPVVGQGANTASHAAWALGEAIVAGGPFDEDFCRRVEARIWEYAGPVTEWTNAALQPPAPHFIDLFVGAAQDKAVADYLCDNFDAPERNWALFGSPERAAEYLQRR